MKHLQTLPVLWFLSFFSYVQIIIINDNAHPESSYGPEQLVKDVLISSDCSSANNFSEKVKGQPTDLTTKSYGYFKTPTGSTFPFTEGIVLSTGKAHPAGNITSTNLVDHSNGLTGDSDLENALNVNNTQGETGPTFNPTKEGDYTVLATNKVTLCRIPASTIVIESFPAESVSAEFLLPEFSTPNKLKVEVIGKGDYEYALNDGPWQKENILTNVYHG